MVVGMAQTQPDDGQQPEGLDYAKTGVSTEQADAGLNRLTENIKETWDDRVLLELGHFANVIDIGGQGVAFCTDGVGSKAMVAQMLDRYDTIGIDCVAMNVNDLICVGATPISMVDYIAVETADPRMLEEISIGLTKGAKQAGISISGGEIAQLPGMIHGSREAHGFDLVGAAVGHVDLSKILVGRDIQAGDVIIGVASNGIHSNGLTLARHVFFERSGFGIDDKIDGLEQTLGEELLKPTHIYVREALEILEAVPGVKGLVHITSDGFLNLTRMQPERQIGYVIEELPHIPAIFELIQKLGSITDEEMFHVYNMGVGFCYIAEEASSDAILEILAANGRDASRIGTVKDIESNTVRIEQKSLVGEGKTFRKMTA